MAAETGHSIRRTPAAKPKPPAAKPKPAFKPSAQLQSAIAKQAHRAATGTLTKSPKNPGPSTTHPSTGENGHGLIHSKYANPPAAPYLTGAQQAALNKLLFAYDQKDLTAGQTWADTQAKYGSDMANAIAQSTANADRSAWSMSARGLGESSIRDAALNDISGHLAITENVLNANLARAQTDWQGTLTADDYNRGQDIAGYNDLAVANAQSQLPDPTLAQRSVLPPAPALPPSGGVAATAQQPSTAIPPNSVAPTSTNPPAAFNPNSGTQTYNLAPSSTPGQMTYQLPTAGSAGPIQPHPATGIPMYPSGGAGI